MKDKMGLKVIDGTPTAISEWLREVEHLKKEKYSHIKDWDDETIKLAIELHNKYEILSKEENWETQKSTHLKAFRDLPMENQRVMLRMADFILKKFGGNVKEKPLPKGHVKYGCGHETDGVLILDSNELSMAAYLDWSESVGIFGNKSECFNCWCKEGGEKSKSFYSI